MRGTAVVYASGYSGCIRGTAVVLGPLAPVLSTTILAVSQPVQLLLYLHLPLAALMVNMQKGLNMLVRQLLARSLSAGA